jgi:hypothetical protein
MLRGALSFAVVVAAIAVNTPAIARHSHPGMACKPYGRAAEAILGYWNQGVISNESYTDWLVVFCPVTRRTGEGTPGVPFVCGVDRNTGEGITCSFYDVRSYGHTWDWGPWQETLGSGPDNFTSLFWPGEGASEDTFDGFHHFRCEIPPRQTTYGASWLSSYGSGE